MLVYPVERDTWTTAGLNARRFRHVRTPPNDTFTVHGLPPGRYHVLAVPDVQTSDWRNPAVLETFAARASNWRLPPASFALRASCGGFFAERPL